jgi:two-component system, cell cycle response regulator DivK
MLQAIPEDILKGWSVLVVDDEPDGVEVVKTLLELYGADVLMARNGREGLEIIREHKPRFVVADLSMPEMTGWEMVELIKNDRATASIPVVALTAHAMSKDRDKAMAMGFHNYLTKPLRPETFVIELLMLLTDDIPELANILNQNTRSNP